MEDRWFNVPEVTVPLEGVDPDDDIQEEVIPKHSDREDVAATSGFRLGNSPRYIVRFYAEAAVLDEIAADPDVDEVSRQMAANRFNNARGRDFDAESLERSFRADVEP